MGCLNEEFKFRYPGGSVGIIEEEAKLRSHDGQFYWMADRNGDHPILFDEVFDRSQGDEISEENAAQSF
jgi:hypothetical protein